jgi:hypothetical protein
MVRPLDRAPVDRLIHRYFTHISTAPPVNGLTGDRHWMSQTTHRLFF